MGGDGKSCYYSYYYLLYKVKQTNLTNLIILLEPIWEWGYIRKVSPKATLSNLTGTTSLYKIGESMLLFCFLLGDNQSHLLGSPGRSAATLSISESRPKEISSTEELPLVLWELIFNPPPLVDSQRSPPLSAGGIILHHPSSSQKRS